MLLGSKCLPILSDISFDLLIVWSFSSEAPPEKLRRGFNISRIKVYYSSRCNCTYEFYGDWCSGVVFGVPMCISEVFGLVDDVALDDSLLFEEYMIDTWLRFFFF